MKVECKEDGKELVITLTFNEYEVNYLKHDLPGVQGIVDWYAKGPSSEKIYKCKERMEKEAIPMLRKKGIAIPASDVDLHNLILSDSDYKDREKRDVKNAP